jgi:MFS family permease
MVSTIYILLNSTGGIPPYIYRDLGGTDRWVWFVLANLLALAAICPFVGALSDLIGRRWVAISGGMFIVLGMIVCTTAHTMNTFIGQTDNIPSSSSHAK